MIANLLRNTLTGVFALGAVTALSGPASAESVATRCDGYGCAKIVCYRNGDRCYRVDRDERWYGRDDDYHRSRWYSGYSGRYGYSERERAGWRYRCDYDGDRCDVRRERYRDDGW